MPASISTDKGIVDHRLVVDRQELLGNTLRDRMKACSGTAREYNSLHDASSSRWAYCSSYSTEGIRRFLWPRPSLHGLRYQSTISPNPSTELEAWLPAQLPLNLARIDRIAAVVPRPVLNIAD